MRTYPRNFQLYCGNQPGIRGRAPTLGRTFVDGPARARVYDKIATFVPPPKGVTREGVLSLNEKMLEQWREQLEPNWSSGTLIPKSVAEAYWKVKNGDSTHIKQR